MDSMEPVREPAPEAGDFLRSECAKQDFWQSLLQPRSGGRPNTTKSHFGRGPSLDRTRWPPVHCLPNYARIRLTLFRAVWSPRRQALPAQLGSSAVFPVRGRSSCVSWTAATSNEDEKCLSSRRVILPSLFAACRKIGSNIFQGLLVQHRSSEAHQIKRSAPAFLGCCLFARQDPAAFEATPCSAHFTPCRSFQLFRDHSRCCICMESFSACQLWHCGRAVCGEKA